MRAPEEGWGGVLPYISYVCAAHRVELLRRFGLNTGIHFAYFGLESGMVLGGTTGVYGSIVSIPNEEERKRNL